MITNNAPYQTVIHLWRIQLYAEVASSTLSLYLVSSKQQQTNKLHAKEIAYFI